ncbi:hypothetical protein NBRC110019_24420 [Neptunitalea chrysea]|uniref:DUF4836 family protein n=1 Tax=Neptunitalea chrysea TaxID=1647581 RepID=A0A9W6B5W4_9FLAO|nr:hypothetical protein [Neptunitalea chrysea]GLB53401.1 hypothetical protein NBRC110019_24420 [Neptunitalea chrysea]
MKKLIAFLLLGTTVFINAQETIEKVPANAKVVVSANSGNLLELMSIKQLEESLLGKMILPQLEQMGIGSSFKDVGLDLKGSAQYFLQSNDSIMYNVVVLPIKNHNKLESAITTASHMEIVQEQELHTIESKDIEVSIVWSKEYFVFVYGALVSSYFKQDEVIERYGLEAEKEFSWDNYIQSDSLDTDVEMVLVKEAVDEPSDETEEIEITEEIEEPDTYVVVEKVENVDYEEDIDYEEDMEYDAAEYNHYHMEVSANDSIKGMLTTAWSFKKAKQIIRGSKDTSIIRNKDFKKSIDDKAELSIYIDDFTTILEPWMDQLGLPQMRMSKNLLNAYEGMSNGVNLYLNDTNIELTLATRLNDEMADYYKGIYDRDLNDKFLNYINEDKAIGYAAMAINTENILKEYPGIVSRSMPNIPYVDKELVDIATEAFSLILDEKAIGELINGDGVVVFNGINEREVTYTTYEYNEETWESEEIQETKMEKIPEMLIMLSSDNPSILNKLIAYGVKKQVITNENGYYDFKIPDFPMSVYVIIKDGIVFISNSKEEATQIASGTFVPYLTDEHKSMLTKNKFAAYFDGSRLAQELPVEDMGIAQMKVIIYMLDNFGSLSMETSKMKGNTITNKIEWAYPAGKGNAMEYFFDMIQNMPR